MTIAEMLQARAKLVADARAIVDTAEAAKRDLSAEESQSWDKINDEVNALGKRIERTQQQAAMDGLTAAPIEGVLETPAAGAENPRAGDGYHNALLAYARRGLNGITPDINGALQVGTDSEGGFIVSEAFETALVMALSDMNIMRGIATVVRSATTNNIPVETDEGVATWTAEEAAFTESDTAFSRKIIGAHKLGRIIKVSEELLNDSIFDLVAYISNAFARSFGTAEEAAFVNGDGTAKPRGFLLDSTLGVTTAAVAAITADEIMDLYHSLRVPYRATANFVGADSTFKIIRKLKDSNGQYMWQPGMKDGEADRLLGRPVNLTEAMPAATAGLKSLAFGDFSYYRIQDRIGVVMQRLNELYAANGQVGFRMYERTDGALLLPEAVKHLIQAAV